MGSSGLIAVRNLLVALVVAAASGLSAQMQAPTQQAQASAPQPNSSSTTATSPPPNATEISAHDAVTTFKVNVRLVQVRVVVRDRQGHVIGNLHKEDFRLFDNGKLQPISRFSVEQPGTRQAATNTSSGAAEAAPATPATSQPATALAIPDRYVAYVFDDVHLKLQDLMLIRNAAARHLASLQPTDRAAIFTTSGQDNLDFTDDHARLRDDLGRLMPRPRGDPDANQCPFMNYYEANLIVNRRDAQAIAAATEDALVCAFNNDPQFLTAARGLANSTAFERLNVGDAETRLALIALTDAVRRISVTPGQRTIVLASPGFLVPEQQFELQDVVDRALQSNIVVNSIDARGMYTVVPGTDVSHRSNTPAAAGGLETLYQISGASEGATVLAELADATGGTFFHNSNNLDEGFRRVGAAEFYYMLGFSPQNLKLDGKFHKLQVKLTQPADFTLQARKGYYAPTHAVNADEEAKQEIEDAIFSQDESHDLPVELHTQFFKLSEDNAKLAVLVHLDVRQLHYAKTEGRNRDNVTVVSALFDRNGRFINAIEKTVEMRWKDETLESKLASGITLKSDFDVKPGAYMVRLVVRDSGGELSAENGAVEIP